MQTHSGPRSRLAMPHLHLRGGGSSAVAHNGHGRRAPPATATTPRSTVPIGNGLVNCMEVQTRHNSSHNGGRKSPGAFDGCNSAESEIGGKAPDVEM